MARLVGTNIFRDYLLKWMVFNVGTGIDALSEFPSQGLSLLVEPFGAEALFLKGHSGFHGIIVPGPPIKAVDDFLGQIETSVLVVATCPIRSGESDTPYSRAGIIAF